MSGTEDDHKETRGTSLAPSVAAKQAAKATAGLPKTDMGKPEVRKALRRIVDAACDISEMEAENPTFLHAVLCQVGLPRQKPEGRVFERTSGKAGLRLEAGTLFRPGQGGFKELPLPYGARPRLILHHICSEAIRTKEQTIDIGGSLAGFLDKLGIHTGGGEYTRFKNQMTALCGVRMTLGYADGLRSLMMNTAPISRFEAWTHYDRHQLGFWPGHLEISAEFFDTLCGHAVPLDPRAIHALKQSSFALDVYTWLAHRLCRVRKDSGVKLSWRNLKEQFGQEYRSPKDFKKEFKHALLQVRMVYPDARIEEVIGGLMLYPSPPPVPKMQVVVELPGKTADQG